MQACEHLRNQDDPSLEGVDRPLLSGIQYRSHVELRGHLPSRPPSIHEELAELGHGAPAARLSYVGGYGQRRAHELVGALEAAGSLEGACETHSIGRKLAG